MSDFTGAGYTPVQRGSKYSDRIYRERLQRGGDHTAALRHLYATGYVEGGGKVMLDNANVPIHEYDEARRRFLSHGEALDEVLIAGYQVSPEWHARSARIFADEIAQMFDVPPEMLG